MNAHLRANFLLLVVTIVLCCVVYPAILFGIGQTVFHDKAEGSLIYDKQGKPIGSHLIAQPFSGEGYFQPRPSAVSYNAAGSGGSNWGANQYLLRERVARQLGPIVKYAGARKGQPVGPDVEAWFQKDQYDGKPGIVAQWAAAHGTVASNWAKADPLNGGYVLAWMNDHADDMAQWKKDNPDNAAPKPEDMAVTFFSSFSKVHPGEFPSAVESATADGKSEKTIQPVKAGTDIQGIFFDLWRQEHPTADLEPVPADMVMASGSGLDPHITLKNALYQLDRVAARRAADTNRNVNEVRKEIEALLQQKKEAPLGGLVGVDLVNVLEVNLALRDR
ncbi:MAG: potassium-transporting ATPase subunit C [Planctomycetia bacterium]|nr:potassium-transporting ATPase subunit C [Planctomycetia bacterium]